VVVACRRLSIMENSVASQDYSDGLLVSGSMLGANENLFSIVTRMFGFSLFVMW
jgi:hypothetical protein